MTSLLLTRPRCSRGQTRSGHHSPHARARQRSCGYNSLPRKLGNRVQVWVGKESSPQWGHLSGLYLTDSCVLTKPNQQVLTFYYLLQIIIMTRKITQKELKSLGSHSPFSPLPLQRQAMARFVCISFSLLCSHVAIFTWIHKMLCNIGLCGIESI